MWAITLLTRIKNAVHTIRFKLLFAYLLIVVIAFTAIGAAMIRLVGEYVFARSGEEYLRRLESVSAEAQEALLAGESQRLFTITENLTDSRTGRAAVLDANGSVVCDSLSRMNGYRFSILDAMPELKEADACFRLVKSSLLGTFDLPGQSRVILCAVNLNGGTLVASYPSADIVYSLSRLWKQLAAVMAAIVAVTLLMGG